MLAVAIGCSGYDARFVARMNRGGALQHTLISTYREAHLAQEPEAVAELVGPEHAPDSSPAAVSERVRELLHPFLRVTRSEPAISAFEDDGDRIRIGFRVRLDGEGWQGERVTVRLRRRARWREGAAGPESGQEVPAPETETTVSARSDSGAAAGRAAAVERPLSGRPARLLEAWPP